MNENQALNLNLHPLQKHVNRGRLMDILEEVNVQTVNNVVVDLNIMLHHNHFSKLLVNHITVDAVTIRLTTLKLITFSQMCCTCCLDVSHY